MDVRVIPVVHMSNDYRERDLINKWKPILEYTSDNVKKLNENQYFEVAIILERHEKWIANGKMKLENILRSIQN